MSSALPNTVGFKELYFLHRMESSYKLSTCTSGLPCGSNDLKEKGLLTLNFLVSKGEMDGITERGR